MVEDHSSGDVICSKCGLVQVERSISTEAEYRLFSDDSGSASKVRVGASYNPFFEHKLTSNSKWERDEKEFLWDGFKNIEELLERLLQDTKNTSVQCRAKELFQKAFKLQLEQKAGKKRQRFAKRKQYVVACLFWAFQEHGIHTWSFDDFNRLLDGIHVSRNSLKKCLKELGLPFYLAKYSQPSTFSSSAPTAQA